MTQTDALWVSVLGVSGLEFPSDFGFGGEMVEGMRPNPGARIPVKLHRRVCLIQTEDAVLAEELLARRKMAQDIVGRLTERVLLVRPGRVEAVVEELKKMGHTPQVVSR
jgi:hypothetical protein